MMSGDMLQVLESHATSWYGLIIIAVVLFNIIDTLNHKRLAKKLGASGPYMYGTDYMFGFKQAYEMLKAKTDGVLLTYTYSRFELYHDTVVTPVAANRMTITRDPENVKALLGTQFNDYDLGIRHKQFLPLLGDGIFTLDNQGWKHSRAMLRPQFAREQVAHVKSLEPHVQKVMAHVRKHNGKPFDIQEIFFRLTLDSATEFLFGESVDSLCDGTIDIVSKGEVDSDLKQMFAQAFNDSQQTLSDRAILQKFYFFINTPAFRRNCKNVHALTDIYVQKALEATPEELEKKSADGYTFLYELVKQTRDPKVLRDQALNILLAGRDTTAGLMSFAFFELARNPKMYAKLKEEIYATFGSGKDARVGDISFESLKKCEYLKAFINETLRLYPSVPQNFRTANKPTTLPRGGGKDGMSKLYVPKNGVVFYSISSTHRTEAYYGEDASEFRPERWFEESTRKLGWAYLPFNGGPRICLGQQFALTEASYVLTRLIQEFPNLEGFDTEYPPRTNSQLTMCLLNGANISLT